MRRVLLGLVLGMFIFGIFSLGLVVAEENCTDTCTILNYSCGMQTVCNSSTSCGNCSEGYVCGSGKCNAVSVCDSNHLNLCLNKTSCESASGEWKNATCIAEDEDDNETDTEVQVCSTITNKTLCEAKKNCEYNNATGKCEKIEKEHKLKVSLQAYLNSTECPEDCVCAGSAIKCNTENGRVMTVVAGKSGNVIIITQTANASTSVVLIKNSTGFYGNFSGKVKKIKYLPDEIKERVLKKLKIENSSSYNITLQDDGNYVMNIDGKYRVLWIFPKKTIVVSKINSETGEVTVLKNPFWKFRAE